MIERCRRMVEAGRDVVLALDSLTALTRAYHLELGYSGRLLCAGLDAAAVVRPKKLFGARTSCYARPMRRSPYSRRSGSSAECTSERFEARSSSQTWCAAPTRSRFTIEAFAR